MARDKLFAEVYQYAQRWNRATRRVLEREMLRKDVKDTEALQKSLSQQVTAQGDKVVATIAFLLRGRFVDMGVGRGRPLGSETIASNTDRLKKRWYSPAWYGRLNTLRGVVGIKVMEETVATIKQLEDAS